ncbi:hypothetical protein A2397_01970 [Candidatus Amesbacteria bacterium RIFOXYB1_FULL_44_23]|uniref:Uncharacterized protein n=1 Tax=Candidatus Amesbacteria bacterium RIFOXYB1_FULL_44_23 TaxID=1797263 RepID=A0A1F4ZSS2_9BACT|nr:MAG: hypothetical protein A2397_01970 [Candidatus Amesbacteria bacterium RIFOXYB1_FULL_44_23]
MPKSSFLPLLLVAVVTFSVFIIIFLRSPQVSTITNLPYPDNPSPTTPNVTPMPTSTSLTPPSLPSKVKWAPVSESQVITNQDVLNWLMDLRKCPPKGACPEDLNLFKTGSSDLPGKEWVYYHQVTQPDQATYHRDILGFSTLEWAKQNAWSGQKYYVKPGYSFSPAQGAQSATYQPECIYGVRNDQIKVACLTRIVSKSSTSGSGMQLKYIYPYTEEFRYFISDTASIPQLLLQVNFQNPKSRL